MVRAIDVSKLQIDPRYLLIMLLPVVVLIVSEYLLGTFGDTTLHLEGLELKDQSRLIELSARYRFLAALFFFGGATVSVTAIFVFELSSRHTRRSILTTIVGILGIIVVSLSFSTFEPDWMPAGFESQALLGDNLFHALLIPASLAGCDAGGEPAEWLRSARGVFRDELPAGPREHADFALCRGGDCGNGAGPVPPRTYRLVDPSEP